MSQKITADTATEALLKAITDLSLESDEPDSADWLDTYFESREDAKMLESALTRATTKAIAQQGSAGIPTALWAAVITGYYLGATHGFDG